MKSLKGGERVFLQGLKRLFLISFLLVGLGILGKAEITLGPYLQPTEDLETSIAIAWRTSVPTTGSVSYGIEELEKSVSSSTVTTRHYIKLDGLEPGKIYQYRVTAGGETSPVYQFKTLAPGLEVKILILSDIHSQYGNHDEWVRKQRLALPEMLSFDPQIIIVPGDLDHGEEVGYVNIVKVYSKLLARSVLCPAPGNHDEWGRGAYQRVFYLPASRSSSRQEASYYFGYGDVYFWSLSQWPEGWLDRSIQKVVTEKRPNFLVLYHHYSMFYYWDGRWGRDKGVLIDNSWKRRIARICDEYQVDFVYGGHMHGYQRTYPLVSNGDREPRIVSQEKSNYEGALGGTIYHTLQSICYNRAYRYYPHPIFAASGLPDRNILGFVKVTVKGNIWRQELINYSNRGSYQPQVVDQFTFTKKITPIEKTKRERWVWPRPRLYFNPLRGNPFSLRERERRKELVRSYNILGQWIREGTRLTSGVYFYEIEGNRTKKYIVLK
jgi:hypothetical protein